MVSLSMSENIKDIFLVAANILTGKCETDTFQVKIDVAVRGYDSYLLGDPSSDW